MKRSIYLISILIALFSQQGFAQNYTPVKGTINAYTAINEILCYQNFNHDSVFVASTDSFDEGDTVMIYCVQGAEIETTDRYGEDEIGRDAQMPNNTGKYAFMIIDTIDRSLKLIGLNTVLTPEIKPMKPGEVAQLIKVHSYKNAEVLSEGVYAQPWDPVSRTGGVVALFVHGTLKLSGDIHAEHSGFNGAPGSTDDLYGGDCSVSDLDKYGDNFYYYNDVFAGLKGESTTNILFDSIRGKAMNINGGGGGNGLFSGGGGGSNYSGGGKGGNESTVCTTGISPSGGAGGFQMKGDYYVNGNGPKNTGNRIFLGGGGGSGTRLPPKVTTDGGKGGGIVVIVAENILGNNNWIRADGESVTDIATGAAGGGGGGGCIILDVNGYKDSLNLSAIGGNGGNTLDTYITGPGGGGGGGIYWLSGNNHPGVYHNPDDGNPGQHLSDPPVSHGADYGGNAFKEDGLEVPIWGFIFNPVPTEFWVCSDQVPDDIVASIPKGGGGPSTYEYLWVDSSATDPLWAPAPGINDGLNYEFLDIDGITDLNLDDTAYYRRVVIDNRGILENDTSFRIAVYVHPKIEGNTISAPDTVCFGDSAKRFISSAIIGGGPNTEEDYWYVWQKDEFNGRGLEDADGDVITDSTYQTPGLSTTTNFYRIAGKGGVCADTSNAVFVQVWEKLEDYQITDNDTVCYNERLPHELVSLTELPPVNGDTLDIRYKWITSLDLINWSDIPGATSEIYQPSIQTQTTYYSRVVLSGSDNACVETAEYVEILNIDTIENNTIADTRTVCTGDNGGDLIGSVPTGGLDDLQFSFTWQSRTQSTGWITEDSSIEVRVYNPGLMDGDTTWYRRMVGAGGVARDVCFSYSKVDTIHVLPPVTNNLITTSDSVKCEDDMLEWLTQETSNGSTPIGGDATWIYQWQEATGTIEPDTWGDIVGATSIDYLDQPQLDRDDDRWYRRHVYSGPENQCQGFSDTIHVTVHTGITGNTIDPLDSACFNSYKEVLGALPLGEDGLIPIYAWRDAVSGADLPGIQGQNYSDTFSLQQLYQFEREVQIGACADTSNTMSITVMQLPGGMLSGDISQSCETEVMLDVALSTEGLDNYILPWHVTLKNGVNENLDGPYPLNEDGEVEVTLNTDADSTQFYYTIAEISYKSETDRYICMAPPEQLSGEVPIMVFRTPEPQITVDEAARETFKVCGTTVDLEADADRGNGLWTFNPSNYISASASSGNGYLISIPNSTEAYGTYKATFTSIAGVCSGADSIDLYYFEQPQKPDIGGDTVLFLINEVELKASEPTAGYGEWTVNPPGPIIEDKDSPHTIARNMGLNAENIFTWTVRNGEDEGECIDTSDFKVVIRTEVKRYQGFSPNGDMDNEYFIMQGLMYADEFSVFFFNSLGNTVREITNENIDQVEYDPNLILDQREDELVVWDGKSENGTVVPNGTYYYVVHYIKDGIDYPYQDYVVVLKE